MLNIPCIIIDSNVLLHDPRALTQFPNNEIIIPIEIVEEVEKFKKDTGELGNNSRMVANILDQFRELGNLGKGIKLENNGYIKIIYDPDKQLPQYRRNEGIAESRILEIAKQLTLNKREVTIITKNVNLRLKADILGIKAENYNVGRIIDTQKITGWRSIKVSDNTLTKLKNNEKVNLKDLDGYSNEFLHLVSQENTKKEDFAIIKSNGTQIERLPILPKTVTGVTPLSIEQHFALNALLDDNINLVTLTGKAGTGKTLLAIAAALYKMYNENIYNKVIVFRPTMPVGRDMGFLPGDLNEKMGPWMQPIFDAVDLLKILDRKAPTRSLPPDLLESGDLSIEPLTYIRGRSIPNQFIIIDEAQNLTPLEVKTVITRVGKNSKIVLTGDPQQIDNPYIDSKSNGLSCLVNKFLGHDLYAHIGLLKGERSAIAEAAANLL